MFSCPHDLRSPCFHVSHDRRAVTVHVSHTLYFFSCSLAPRASLTSGGSFPTTLKHIMSRSSCVSWLLSFCYFSYLSFFLQTEPRWITMICNFKWRKRISRDASRAQANIHEPLKAVIYFSQKSSNIDACHITSHQHKYTSPYVVSATICSHNHAQCY